MKHSLIKIAFAAGMFVCVSSPMTVSAKVADQTNAWKFPTSTSTENPYSASEAGAGPSDEEDVFSNLNPADKDEDGMMQEMKAKKKKKPKKVKKKVISHAS